MIEYDPITGASCPKCGSRSPVTNTRNIEEGLRYHKCPNCGFNFQSIYNKNKQYLINRLNAIMADIEDILKSI